MASAQSTTQTSIEVVRAIRLYFDNVATTSPVHPPHIAESDRELQGPDDCQRVVDTPLCIRERTMLRTLEYEASCKPQPQPPSDPVPLGAWGAHLILPYPRIRKQYSSSKRHPDLPSELSSCLSSLSEVDTDSFDEADSSSSLPVLSYGPSMASYPCDADDPRSPGTQSTPQTTGSVPSDTQGASPTGVPGPGKGRRGTKRPRPPSTVMSSDHESQPSRSRRQRTEDRPRVILSCPFYKWDPARYRNCRRILLTKISYVKQHILRAHRMPPHCQICNTSFPTDDELRQHIRSRTCDHQPYTPPDGVTEDQIFQLRSRVNQKNSLEDQWYEVFEIVFPGATRPASVYLDPELSQDLDEFVNFLTMHGPRIIMDKVNVAGSTSEGEASSQSTASLTSGLSRALQEVYDQWYRSRAVEEVPSSLPKPLTSGHVEQHSLLRPPTRSLSAMSGRGGSLSQHETSFALGGSEAYGELAPLRFPPRASWDARSVSSPLAIQSSAGLNPGLNPGPNSGSTPASNPVPNPSSNPVPPELETNPAIGRGDRHLSGSRFPSPPRRD